MVINGFPTRRCSEGAATWCVGLSCISTVTWVANCYPCDRIDTWQANALLLAMWSSKCWYQAKKVPETGCKNLAVPLLQECGSPHSQQMDSGHLFNKGTYVLQQDFVKSRKPRDSGLDFSFGLQFDWHLCSSAAEMPVRFQSDHYNIQTRAFETPRYLAVRRLTLNE